MSAESDARRIHRLEYTLAQMTRAIQMLERRTSNMPVRWTLGGGAAAAASEEIGTVPHHSHLHTTDGGAGALQFTG